MLLIKRGPKAVSKGSKKLWQIITKRINYSAALRYRKNLGQVSLKRALTNIEIIALEKAHLIGKGKIGKDGTAASVGNYTLSQLRKKKIDTQGNGIF